MCFGLQNKSHCILNKQYEENDYYKIVDEMKSEMLKRGEYGDGLDFSFSAQPYNFSSGYSTYLLTDDQIKEFGGYIGDEPETNAENMNIISLKDLPQTIEETKDEILNQAILCQKTHRPFRIIPTELEFYRNMRLPLPTMHPTPRMRVFADLKPTSKKYQATCAKCNQNIQSMVNPNDGYLLYCEKCYQDEVV
jgi:hypothetical protein